MMFKKKFGIILVLCFICIGLTGCGSKEEKATIIDVNGNKVELSHSELMEEYNNNQTRFTNNYMTAKVTVTGTIEKVEDSSTFYSGTYTCGTYGQPYYNKLSFIKFKEGWIAEIFNGVDEVNIMDLNNGDIVTITSNIAYVTKSNIYLAAFDGKHCVFGKTPTTITKK